MVPQHDADPAELYEHERLAFVAFLRDVPRADLATTVAATPAWSVLDVLAHVVAIPADLNALRFGELGADGEIDADAWTAAQVAGRRGRTVDELALEWDREAPTFESGLRLFGYSFAAHYLGDLLQHVGDVHTALGRSSARDDDSVAVALDFYLETFEETLATAGVGAVEVRSGAERWTLGVGEVVASVGAPRHELFRALGGRRTLDEVRDLDWSGDADRIVGLLSCYPVPVRSLGETRPPQAR